MISSLRAAGHAAKPYPYNLQYHFHSIENHAEDLLLLVLNTIPTTQARPGQTIAIHNLRNLTLRGILLFPKQRVHTEVFLR